MKLKIPALLAVAASVAIATGLTAPTANAAVTCAITKAPTTVSVGLTVKNASLAPTTNCPPGSKVQFEYIAIIPRGVPNTEYWPLFFMSTNSDGNVRALHRPDGTFPFGATSAGDVLAGRPMGASYSAFVDVPPLGQHEDEPVFKYSTTLTILRATRIVGFSAGQTTVEKGGNVRLAATVQRADWETQSWRAFRGGTYKVQFQADGSGKWTTQDGTIGSFSGMDISPKGSGNYRIRYQGDVVSGASYSKAVHITVT